MISSSIDVLRSDNIIPINTWWFHFSFFSYNVRVVIDDKFLFNNCQILFVIMFLSILSWFSGYLIDD